MNGVLAVGERSLNALASIHEEIVYGRGNELAIYI